MELEDFNKKKQKIPDTPGVYFFLGKRKEVLYIGKATSLVDRLRSYFTPDIALVRSPLIANMVHDARTIDWRSTDSVLEALILEAQLVRTYKPKANTDLKDDKTFNYVVITKEDFPRMVLVRGKVLETDFPKDTRLHTFGPFPHGGQLKEALRIIRKIFPYRDTCTPCVEKKEGASCRPCFNRQVGLCPGVCSGDISKTEYRKIIRRIALLFSGKKPELIRSLEKDMKTLAKQERFEDAAVLRKQLFALNHIQDVSLIKNEYRSPLGALGIERIEAYDVAHLAGTSTVGVMVVVENGMPQKAEYRKFRIRTAKAGDDAGALSEILSRRLGHDEWPLPRLIVVDGSTIQIRAAQKILAEHSIEIPIVGVVKDEKHRPRELKGDAQVVREKEQDILLANSEAHRYAISYHRKKSRENMGLL